MARLELRLDRLEQRMGTKPGPRLIYFAPNLEEGEGDESPYMVKISSDLWAYVFGGPLTDKESHQLREEYKEERHLK